MENISNKQLASLFVDYKSASFGGEPSFYQTLYFDKIKNNKEAILYVVDAIINKYKSASDITSHLKSISQFDFFQSDENRVEVGRYIAQKLESKLIIPVELEKFVKNTLLSFEEGEIKEHKSLIEKIERHNTISNLTDNIKCFADAVKSPYFKHDEYLEAGEPRLSGNFVNDYLSLQKEPDLDVTELLTGFADEINALCAKSVVDNSQKIKILLTKSLSTILIVNFLDLPNKNDVASSFWNALGAKNVIRIFSEQCFSTNNMFVFTKIGDFHFPFQKEMLMSAGSIKLPSPYYHFPENVELTIDEFENLSGLSIDELKALPTGIETIKDVNTFLNTLVNRYIDNCCENNTRTLVNKPFIKELLPQLHEETKNIKGASRLILEKIILLEENPNIDINNNIGDILGEIVYKTDVRIDKDVLNRIACHHSESTRMCCLFYSDLPEETEMLLRSSQYYFMNHHQKSERFKGLVANSNSYHIINGLKDAFDVFHSQYGYSFELFKDITSQASVCKILFNSKHKEEVRFLFESGNAESLTAISSLQAYFTNVRGKLDRQSYLSMLSMINEAVELGAKDGAAKQSGLAVAPEVLKFVFSFFTFENIMFIINNNTPNEARDIFRMTHSLCVHDDPETAKKQTNLVKKWLEKENSLSYSFHKYLEGKVSRDLAIIIDEITLYQSVEGFDIKELHLEVGLPRDMKVTLPQTGRDLRRLGREQHHCVGSKFYVDSCANGISIIFALTPNNDRGKTVTVEIAPNGAIKQMQGHSNRKFPSSMRELAKTVGGAILSYINKRKSEDTSLAA